MQWKAVEFNIAKQLQSKANPKFVKIPPDMVIQVVLDLDGELYKKLSKNPTWIQQMQSKAKARVDAGVAEAVKEIQAADKKAANFDPSKANIFSKDLTTQIQSTLKGTATESAKEVEKFYEAYKKSQSELKHFKLKTVGKITFSAVMVAAGSGATVVTGGALAPLQLVGLIRSVISISQDCFKLASTADKVATLIKADLAVLKKVIDRKMAT